MTKTLALGWWASAQAVFETSPPKEGPSTRLAQPLRTRGLSASKPIRKLSKTSDKLPNESKHQTLGEVTSRRHKPRASWDAVTWGIKEEATEPEIGRSHRRLAPSAELQTCTRHHQEDATDTRRPNLLARVGEKHTENFLDDGEVSFRRETPSEQRTHAPPPHSSRTDRKRWFQWSPDLGRRDPSAKPRATVPWNTPEI